jgi:pimeloyl-ACP methyl ester carboxylesterase
MKPFKLIWICILSVAIFSCSDDDDKKPNVEESNLVSATVVSSRSASELRLLIQLSGQDVDPSVFRYNARVYRVTYNTTYKGDEILASGLVALPITTDKVPMLSVHHGTIVQHNAAPSEQGENDEEMILYSALASSGLITLIPDMIGFGESKEIFHPYYVEEPTATAIVDLIKASKKLFTDNKVGFNEKLFLAGYSQGGYATMAAHKAIEADPIDGMQLVASFPAAGGYDIKAMQDYFFGLDQYSEPFYIGYVGKSYQSYYGYTNILTDFFREPYASRIPTLFDGVNSGSQINGQLTTTIAELIQPDIRANINTDARYGYILDAFAENSLVDWAPINKMFMYHGDADVTVPYVNSVITYEKLLANGASAGVVQLIALPNATHGSGAIPYFADVIGKIEDLK